MRTIPRHLPRSAARHVSAVVTSLAGVLAIAVAFGAMPAAAAPTARSCQSVRGHRVCTAASISLTRTRVTAVGGLITIRYAASGATTCSLRATPAFWKGHNPAHVKCHGTYRIRVTPAHTRRAWTFTFYAGNRFGHTIRVNRSLVATAPPKQLLVTPYNSQNWSGYAIEGGAFSGIGGAFTVPTLTSIPGTLSDTSEWVGIDGVSNSSLIQAGVHESDDGAGHTRVYAWWEILPAAETAISTTAFPVVPGDTVGVRIQKLTGRYWRITLTDGAEKFATTQSYSGAQTSAEWVVEAPSYLASDGTEQIATLGDFSKKPIEFSGLGVAGVQMALDRIFLLDINNNTVSSPSVLSNGFTVTYTPPPPPSP